MKKTKAEQKRRQKLRTEKYREKMIAEGKKQYNFYLENEAQENFEKIKENFLNKFGKTKMTISETFEGILREIYNQSYEIDSLKSERDDIKEKHAKLENDSKRLLDAYKAVKDENTNFKTEIDILKAR
jgi:hypothetical protein